MTVTMEPPATREVVVRRWRAGRFVLYGLGALLLVTVILAALSSSVHTDYLDPATADREGTRALAQIIQQHGTPVRVARNARTAVDLDTPDSITVIVRPDRLTAADLRILGTQQGDLLLVEPDPTELAALAPGVETASSDNDDTVLDPRCPDPGPAAAGQVGFGPGNTFQVSGRSAQASCYPDGSLPRLVRVSEVSRNVTVLGSGAPLTNQHLAAHGNAALGLNLVGGHSQVVWLIPDLPQPGSAPKDQSFGDMIPHGVKLATLQVVIAIALVAGWRMRRFGPIVTERLPVVVRSAETVEGRARLYRGRRARGRAADALRAGALDRIAPRLGLPRSAAQDKAAAPEIVRAVSARSGDDEQTVTWCLYGGEPRDDAELVLLSDLLDELEKKVLGT